MRTKCPENFVHGGWGNVLVGGKPEWRDVIEAMRDQKLFGIEMRTNPMNTDETWRGEPDTKEEMPGQQDFKVYASPTSLVMDLFPLELFLEILPQQY